MPAANVVPVKDPALMLGVGTVVHTPSPRQKVEEDALLPLLNLEIGKFPVTSEPRSIAPPAVHVFVPVLRTIPVVLNASTAARSFTKPIVNVPVVVIGPPDIVKAAEEDTRETEVTVPTPEPPELFAVVIAVTLPLESTEITGICMEDP
jgi:hypothetical protein